MQHRDEIPVETTEVKRYKYVKVKPRDDDINARFSYAVLVAHSPEIL